LQAKEDDFAFLRMNREAQNTLSTFTFRLGNAIVYEYFTHSMKKFYLSFFLILSFTAYALTEQTPVTVIPQMVPSDANTPPKATPKTSPVVPSTPPVAQTTIPEKIVSQIRKIVNDDEGEGDESERRTMVPSPVTPTTPAPVPTPNPVPIATAPKPTPTPTGKYKNGTYTGNSINEYYGSIQVAAIISGGKLSNISFLQYPNYGNSGNINSYALPILRSEAISAQSANIDAVSGASETSPAFIASLDSALKQALN